MMEVHFNFPEPLPTKLGQSVKVFGVVLLQWIEKGVTGWPTVAVPKLSEQARIVPDPSINAFSSLSWRHHSVARLKMIGNAKENVDGSTRSSDRGAGKLVAGMELASDRDLGFGPPEVGP